MSDTPAQSNSTTPSQGLVAFAVLHHVLAAAAVLLLGSETKIYSVILSAGAFGFLSVIVRRGWQVAAAPEMSPGKAQGFLFIPFFNFYWIFRALPGLARALSRRAEQVAVPTAKRVSGFALTAAILFCIRGVTLFVDSINALDGLLCVIYLGFCVVFIWQVIGAVKALEKSSPASRPMGTVATSAIVLGPLAAMLAFVAAVSASSPDIHVIEKKGYRIVFAAAEGAVSYDLRQAGIVAQRITVLSPGSDRVGSVYAVPAEGLSEAQLADATRIFGMPGEKVRGIYYFKATRRDLRQEGMKFKDWVESF